MSKALVIKGANFSANKVDTVVFADIPCVAVSLNKSTASLKFGETLVLSATLTPSNTTDTVSWTSSNDAVA